MNKNRKTGIAAALTALVLLIIGIVPYAMAEEPGMTVEAPTVSEPTAGDYSGDADGGYEEYEEVTYPGTEEPTDVPAAVTTAVPLPTEIPEETGDLYSVSFTTPSVWTNAAKGTVTVQINDLTAIGVQRVEYCLNSSWQDITTDYFLTGNGDIAFISDRDLKSCHLILFCRHSFLWIAGDHKHVSGVLLKFFDVDLVARAALAAIAGSGACTSCYRK